jgi:glycosyltransferase involved in cell wall biosynthesis
VLLDAICLLQDDLDPLVRLVFVDSAHDAALRRALKGHPLKDRMIVTDKLSPSEMLLLLARAEIGVSITDQDGTPNSLLETMATAAVPVFSDLPSIREWIHPGKNGFLAAFDHPESVAQALDLALNLSAAQREALTKQNGQIIVSRAERRLTGQRASALYRRGLSRHPDITIPLANS